MKKLSVIAAIAILLISCSGTVSVNNPESKVEQKSVVTATSDNVITFKVNGKEVITSGWTISRLRWSSDASKLWLNITTNMHQDKRAIGVNLNGAVPGTYVMGLENGALSKQSHGSYHPDYSDLSNSYSFTSGSFVISQVDTTKNVVNGTFSGTVQNNKGESLLITEGKIVNGKLSNTINNY